MPNSFQHKANTKPIAPSISWSNLRTDDPQPSAPSPNLKPILSPNTRRIGLFGRCRQRNRLNQSTAQICIRKGSRNLDRYYFQLICMLIVCFSQLTGLSAATMRDIAYAAHVRRHLRFAKLYYISRMCFLGFSMCVYVMCTV